MYNFFLSSYTSQIYLILILYMIYNILAMFIYFFCEDLFWSANGQIINLTDLKHNLCMEMICMHQLKYQPSFTFPDNYR